MQNLKDILQNGQGETLMVVYPHPDDETMANGGFLMAAKQLGWKTIAVILTKGGAGKVFVNPRGLSLKELRTLELTKATKILKVDELVLGDFDDGNLREQKTKWSKWVSEQINKYNPEIAVTYDHSGISGHPDHIVLSLEIKKLVNKKTMLLWSTISPGFAKRIVNPNVFEFASQPDYKLDLGQNWFKKWRAARAHASQSLNFRFAWQHFEWYHKVDLGKNYPHKFVEFKI